MKFPVARTRYVSFDGGVSAETRCQRPDRYAFFGANESREATIPRGAGLSYAAASFSQSATSIDHTAFDRLLAFSPENATLEVEGGTSLGQIEAFLSPRGFFLPVQPGHPKITVGGCIAADVHGKNQFRDGTFSAHVKKLTLFHPSHGTLALNRDTASEAFELTCGGFGLTGNILSATLALKKIEAPFVYTTVAPVPSVERLPEILKEAAGRSELVYTWHDFTARGEAFGRGVIHEGRFATADECRQLTEKPPPRKPSRLSAETRGAWRAPFFNGWTTPPFNRLYGWMQRHRATGKFAPLYDFLFPVHDKEMYFKLFGRNGFFEYQALLPTAAFGTYIDGIRRRLASQPVPITLASAKLFEGAQTLLRFSGSGICLALNFPRSEEGLRFAGVLDALLLDVKGVPNIIKDSRLPQAVVARAFPEYERFRERLRAFDPKRLLCSELSERLRL